LNSFLYSLTAPIGQGGQEIGPEREAKARGLELQKFYSGTFFSLIAGGVKL